MSVTRAWPATSFRGNKITHLARPGQQQPSLLLTYGIAVFLFLKSAVLYSCLFCSIKLLSFSFVISLFCFNFVLNFVLFSMSFLNIYLDYFTHHHLSSKHNNQFQYFSNFTIFRMTCKLLIFVFIIHQIIWMAAL